MIIDPDDPQLLTQLAWTLTAASLMAFGVSVRYRATDPAVASRAAAGAAAALASAVTLAVVVIQLRCRVYECGHHRHPPPLKSPPRS